MMRSPLILAMGLMLLRSSDAKMDIIPKTQDVHLGDEVLRMCKANGEGVITWQKDGEDVDEELVFKLDETSSKLIITKATMQDTGRYTCLCEYESGHKDEVQMQLFVYEGPSFGSTAVYHEFLEGTNGVVPCLVSGQPAVEVSWYKDKEEIPLNERKRVRRMPDNTLLIEKVKREDAGTYLCVAQIKGRPISQQLPISVVVNAPPTAHLREEVKKVIAGPETNVSLRCLVDGLPKPNITWNMPVPFDWAHHHFNSDRSQLTIKSVVRADLGEYVCTATNKIGENSATFMLHVWETPQVSLSTYQLTVPLGQQVSVSCNASGYPEPTLHWLSKSNGRTLVSTSGRVRVIDSVLEIDEVAPSDGGLYSCMAVSTAGNASRDVAIHTQPGAPLYRSITTESTSVFITIREQPNNGGTPVTSFVLQWRQSEAEPWMEINEPVSKSFTIASLKPYAAYDVRLAGMNAAGLGEFSDIKTVRTKGIREPDAPALSLDAMKVTGNSFAVPLKPNDAGQSPLLHYNMRYTKDKEGAEWKENQLPSNLDAIVLKDLTFGSEYQLEVTAVNSNGSSIPATLNFTIAQQPASQSMTKGSIVGVVLVIFLVVFLVVDATCCYTNHCGLLMTIAVKIFGKKVPGLKMLEEGAATTNGEVKLNGLTTPRGSLQHTAVQTSTKDLNEVTCDRAPLTKHEKTQPDRNQTPAEA
ncbi:neural cell adhesion molecule 1 [Synchiropus splendidus]|uniref:neural cell adhesion molecule 1 n=1 Tax=Synchiropus splendidus TaxID=270530 RepID=UPI00237E9FE7|nr:neural cell adhesion molecule 1 [Synchiropus splendidus]